MCVDGDEKKVEVAGCSYYMTPQYPIPGTGTLKIAALAGNQKATKTSTGGKAVLLKGGNFTASFEVQSPAKQPPPPVLAFADSRCHSEVFRHGYVYYHQHQISGRLNGFIMAEKPDLPQRDGTSQANRLQTALAPDYVAVDERSIKDLLAFAREYAKELRYYNVDNQPEEDGWSGFLDPELIGPR